MYIKITSKRQATFPARVLDAMGVKPGDRLEVVENADGFMLRPQRIHPDRLAPLRGKLRKGEGEFNLEKFRNAPRDPALRD